MKNYSFYTVFPTMRSFHLAKDPGMVPFILNKEYGYNSFFVSYVQNDPNDYYVQNYQGVSLVSIPTKKKTMNELDPKRFGLIWYIMRNARKMDIMNLYFFKHSMLYALTFRLFNPKGVLYLKLDLDASLMRAIEKQKVEKIRTFILRLYLKYIPTLVTTESSDSVQYVRNKYKIDYPKLVYIPNGVDSDQIKEMGIKFRKFEEKENLIVSVHRVGTYQKNTELLLNALKNTELQDWRAVIIGSIEEDFKSYIERFFLENPFLREKITFIGPIVDKKELNEWYNKAKIFCLTSRWESFGIVYVEAQHFGDYIVSTPTVSVPDLVKNDLGVIVKTEEELAENLSKLIAQQEIMRGAYPKIMEHSKDFYWKNILGKLDDELKKLLKDKNKS